MISQAPPRTLWAIPWADSIGMQSPVAIGRQGQDPGLRGTGITIAVMDGLQIQWLLDPSMEMEAAYNDFIDHYFAQPVRPDDT